MARARLVVSDQNSAELDELRRQFNHLLLLLENLGTQLAAEVTTAPSAADNEIVAVFTSLSDGIAAGTDNDPNSVLSAAATTGLAINGIKPTPLHPRQVRGETRSMTVDDDF